MGFSRRVNSMHIADLAAINDLLDLLPLLRVFLLVRDGIFNPSLTAQVMNFLRLGQRGRHRFLKGNCFDAVLYSQLYQGKAHGGL